MTRVKARDMKLADTVRYAPVGAWDAVLMVLAPILAIPEESFATSAWKSIPFHSPPSMNTNY